jgi:CRP-like cAMP-binding protein
MRKQTQQAHPDGRMNLLLASLDSEDYLSLIGSCKIVTLKCGRRLNDQDEDLEAVYFPLTCMVCLLVSTIRKKPGLELATIGREGVVGAIEVLSSRGALGFHLVQLPGTAVRIPANIFQQEAKARPSIQRLLNLHQYALTRQILQGGLCNNVHTMSQRCARWLLTTHGHARQDSFPVTQEFLSQMLGVRRATVNSALGDLRNAGFISFVRGRLTVLDVGGLERASCGCNNAVMRTYEKLMVGGPKE